jgi:RNA polymerase sigma-70 factor (ECF subfamily)
MDDEATLRDTQAAWISAAVERFEEPLSRYASRLVRDPDRARDVVQDTFLRLCRQDRRSVDGNLASWLYTVCRNRAVDVIRKDHGEVSLESSPEEPAEERPAEAGGPTAGISSDLSRAMSRLSANQQEVIRLKFQQGLKYREIAAVTGLSISNVGFLIHTGIKQMRKALGEKS